MDKELRTIIETIDEFIAPDKTPCFLESEWTDLNILWRDLKERVED